MNTVPGRTPAFIEALVHEVCHAGAELVIHHHGDAAWSGTPSEGYLPAIEEALEPVWRELCGPPEYRATR